MEGQMNNEEKLNLLARLKSLQNDHESKLEHLLRQQNMFVDKIQRLRSEMNSRLDEIEKHFIKDVVERFKGESNRISGLLTRMQDVITSIQRHNTSSEESNVVSNVTVSSGATDNDTLQEAMRTLGEFNTRENTDANVVVNEKTFKTLLDNLQTFSDTILLTGLDDTLSSSARMWMNERHQQQLADYSDMDLVQSDKINIQETDDVYPCYITGSTFLPDGRLLLCDYGNSRLKLLGQDFKRVSSLRFEEQPWDVTATGTGSTDIIVSIPAAGELLLVTVDPRLQVKRKLRMGHKCRGLSFNGSQVFVTHHDYSGDAGVLVLGPNGSIEKEMGNSQDGLPIFLEPQNIAADAGGNSYVSEWWTKDTVTCLDHDGQVKFAFNCPELARPAGLLVDGGQNLIVCGSNSHNIMIINAAGTSYRTLVSTGCQVKYPRTMAIRPDDDTMAVGMMACNHIVLYQFK